MKKILLSLTLVFALVTPMNATAAIKAATGLDIDRHTIATKGHIKKLGSHDVKISLGHNVVAKVSVSVVADK